MSTVAKNNKEKVQPAPCRIFHGTLVKIELNTLDVRLVDVVCCTELISFPNVNSETSVKLDGQPDSLEKV